MLFAKPTPKGTGAEFWGDCNDLESLYGTMSKLAEPSNLSNSYARSKQLLTIIPYDLRHAYQEERLIDHNILNGVDTYTTYYGFRADWITILYTISALRYNAGMVATDELDQSNLMLIEYCTRKALYEFDPIGASAIEQFINSRIDVSTKYVYLIHQELIRRYYSMKPNKTRFRSIPQLLISMGYGKKLEAFIKQVELETKSLGCTIKDLEYDEITSIVW